jgi:TP901 family phage tail tape measure protein
MANRLEYIFSLTDQVSAKLNSIGISSEKTLGVFADLQTKSNNVNRAFNETGRTLSSLRDKVNLLQQEREWIPAENLKGVKAYNSEIKKLNKEINKLENLKPGGFRRWTDSLVSAVPGLEMVFNPIVAGVAALGFAGKSGMDFDQGMANVNITAQLDEAGLNDLKKKIKTIATDNKADITLAPAGFEKINSQLNDVDLSLSILDAALKGSKAGFTELDTVSGALAQTLSIVGKENTSAAEVLDTFFAAKRVGAGEFADFARYMPNLIAGASNLGIAYKEVAGTFAYMTGKGQSAERAAVLMENAFSVLGRGEIRKGLVSAGVKVFDDTGKIRSLVDVFGELQGVMGGLNDEQKSMFLENVGLKDKEAKNAFAILTSDIVKYNESMRDVVGSSGETAAALELSKNSIQKATEVWNSLKNVGVQVGEIMLPLINAGLEVAGLVLSGVSAVLNTVVGFFSSWFTLIQAGNPYVTGLTSAIAALAVGYGVLYAIQNKSIIVSKAITLWHGIQAAATKGLTLVQWALNSAFMASPLGWIALAIGAVVTAVMVCWDKFEGFRKVVFGVWNLMKEFGKTLFNAVVEPIKKIIKGLGAIGGAFVKLFKGDFSGAWESAKEGARDIVSGAIEASPVAIGVNVVKNGDWAGAWEKGQQEGAESWAKSQEEKNKQELGDIPEMPEIPAMPTIPDFAGLNDPLNQEKGKSKKEKAEASTKVLNLNDLSTVQDHNATATYTTITEKLNPVQVSLLPEDKTPATKPVVADNMTNELPAPIVSLTPNIALPMMAATQPANIVNDTTQQYEPKKENFLEDIMMNVRKIAAAATLPLALSTGTDIQATTQPEPNRIGQVETFQPRNESAPGNTINIDRVTEQIVIHVQNTDNRGKEEIRTAIMDVLNEIAEG